MKQLQLTIQKKVKYYLTIADKNLHKQISQMVENGGGIIVDDVDANTIIVTEEKDKNLFDPTQHMVIQM